MALTDHTFTSWVLYKEMIYLLKQCDDVCSNMDCQPSNYDFGYTWHYITYRTVFNVVFNNKSGCRNAVMSCFQTILAFVYSIMMVASLFDVIVVNIYCQCAFNIMISVIVWSTIRNTCQSTLVCSDSTLNSGCYIFVVIRPVALPFIWGLQNAMFQQGYCMTTSYWHSLLFPWYRNVQLLP